MAALRRLLPYLGDVWWLVLLSLVMIGAASALSLLSPWVVKFVIDEVLSAGRWQWLLWGAAAVLLVAVAVGGLRYGQRMTMAHVAQRVIYQLRGRLYEHLQRLSFRFYDRARTGELLAKVTADVELLKNALSMGFVNFIYNGLMLAGVLSVMLYTNWKLALVSLSYMPVLIWAIVQFARRVRPGYWQVQEQLGRLSDVLQENLTGIRVVRAFAREPEEIEKFGRQNRLFLEKNVRVHRLNAFYSQFMNFLTAVGLCAVLWYGGREVIEGRLTVGGLVQFNSYLMMLVWPVRAMGFLTSLFARATAGAQRIFDLLETEADVKELPGARDAGRLKGAVTFEAVSFSYDGRTPVLDRFSLQVQPGSRVAILGATGSGKSSIINLIPRFYDPTAGRVLIDGTDVREFTLKSLRANVAMVMQETFLFSTTLRENIAYGRPKATMEEIIAAARAAQIHDFIAALPRGYESFVGERGVGLSGGQKQRIAIARALLMDAPILILDESTSSVDVATEQTIQAALDRLMQGRTSFIIAQRLSTVMGADLIIVMENGRIAEAGTHAELLRRGGIYKQIYDLQLRPEAMGGVAS